MSVAGPVPDRLSDAWVADGRRGFFVDSEYDPARPPYSLYQTLWRLRLARQESREPDWTGGLSPAAVRGWVERALDGGLVAGGLPAIAQVDYAIRILELVGAPVDNARVARTLEGLRAGDGYRTDRSAPDPDWGSTALAAGALARLGLSVPRGVAESARRALIRQAETRTTAGNVIRVVSLLQVAAASAPFDGLVRTSGLDELVYSAAATLREAASGAVTLAMEAALRETAVRLGVVLPTNGGARGLAISAADWTDPQTACHAVEAGLSRAAAQVRPHSRAGWPTAVAVSDALTTSVAALRLARRYGAHHGFLDPLRAQADEVWSRSRTAGELAQLRRLIEP